VLKRLFLSVVKKIKPAAREGHFAAHKYIAGHRMEDALLLAKDLNKKGFSVTINKLGERTRNKKQIEKTVQEYKGIAARVVSCLV
jgi:uncharacterized protein (UPF0332 family)